MPNVIKNIARVTSTTTGTGTLTLGSAVTGFLTFAQAGVSDGDVVTYAIEDYDTSGNVTAREIGAGTYAASGTTLTRSVYKSTNSDAAISCSGLQHVFITPAAEDLNSFLTAVPDGDKGDITVSGSGATWTIDSNVISTFGRTLTDDADAATARTTLGLGTMAVETATNYLTTAAAAAAYQPLDGELTAIAGLTSAADRLPYFTGSGTAALATFTTAGRNLVDDADAAAQRTTLGLGTAATVDTGTSGATIPLLNADNTWSGTRNSFGYSAASGAVLEACLDTDFGAPFTIYSAQASANPGPNVLMRRLSASPAANDQGGRFLWQMNDDALSVVSLGTFGIRQTAITAGSCSGRILFQTLQAGALAQRLYIDAGLIVGSPTGADKGAGTVNAVTLYENGTALSALYAALASANTFTAAQTISVDSAATNTVTTVGTLRSTSTGTPAAGIGVALDFAAETAAGNNEIGARISAVTTDVTSASEDFDIVFSAMAAGAAVTERGRITSKGTYKHQSFTVAALPAGTAGETCFASNGRKNGEGAGLGTGVLVFHDGTNWCACDTGAAVAA